MPTAEPTADGRYVVINGRRWRATDPLIDPRDSAALRSELMSARRAVKTALHSSDVDAEHAARARVQVAKVGLGERGVPWWEQSDLERQDRVRRALAAFTNDETDGADEPRHQGHAGG